MLSQKMGHNLAIHVESFVHGPAQLVRLGHPKLGLGTQRIALSLLQHLLKREQRCIIILKLLQHQAYTHALRQSRACCVVA
jgi:hypothetical protein